MLDVRAQPPCIAPGEAEQLKRAVLRRLGRGGLQPVFCAGDPIDDLRAPTTGRKKRQSPQADGGRCEIAVIDRRPVEQGPPTSIPMLFQSQKMNQGVSRSIGVFALPACPRAMSRVL
jgi:hypothetical protein